MIDLQAIIYLWTRDADMPVNELTEAYIRNQLKAVREHSPKFSDVQRAQMAACLAQEYKEAKGDT